MTKVNTEELVAAYIALRNERAKLKDDYEEADKKHIDNSHGDHVGNVVAQQPVDQALQQIGRHHRGQQGGKNGTEGHQDKQPHPQQNHENDRLFVMEITIEETAYKLSHGHAGSAFLNPVAVGAVVFLKGQDGMPALLHENVEIALGTGVCRDDLENLRWL